VCGGEPSPLDNGSVPLGGSRITLRALPVTVGVCAVIGLTWLWPSPDPGPDAPALSSFKAVYAAQVVRLDEGPCRGGADPNVRCVVVRAELTEGPDAGRVVTIEQPTSNPRTRTLTVGAGIVLGYQPQVEGFEYVFLDPDRRGPLLLLTGIFVAAVIVLGRWRGVASLLGLLATLLILFWFIVPSILDGNDPLLVSLVGAVVIAFFALYLSHGLNDRTTVALLGTLGGLGVAAILAVAFMGLATLTGLASEEALVVSAVGTNVDLRGLILGGMIIGALGAIDDMTVTQASAVWELRDADRSRSSRHLMRRGMRIGQDHVASTVNTLVLAYAGASMPLLILFILSDQSAGSIANGEIVATEIVRTLVGSIGLVASVPITTWLASRVVAASVERGGRHIAVADAPPPVVDEGPEEHPIPEHRRDVWLARLRSGRAPRS
jgi:uncharacterized membrane protein